MGRVLVTSHVSWVGNDYLITDLTSTTCNIWSEVPVVVVVVVVVGPSSSIEIMFLILLDTLISYLYDEQFYVANYLNLKRKRISELSKEDSGR